jgi:ribonuclease-3
MEFSESEFSQLEEKLGYVFNDKTLLQKALTLSSLDGQFNNQSLECLGDSILNFFVAERFYMKGYGEGAITQMKRNFASDKALTPVSEKLGLDKALLRGKGDDNNKKAVPSAYEAVVAAIYLDGGMECAKQFIDRTMDFSSSVVEIDYISALQELLQSRGIVPPTYEKEECGTPQEPRFVATITVYDQTFTGEGGSFSAAKKSAAQSAFRYAKKIKN